MPRTTEEILKDADKVKAAMDKRRANGDWINTGDSDLIAELSAKLRESEWQPIETAKTDGTWYELLFEGDDDAPNHFENFWQIYHGYHSLRAWRTKDHVTGHPKYYRPLVLPAPPKKEQD